jgi:hypothetical protein
MLSPYMSPIERVWFYSLRILCGLILLFLILPVLVIIPLSFNSGSFLVYPLQGFSLHWYQDFFCLGRMDACAEEQHHRCSCRDGAGDGLRYAGGDWPDPW